MGLFIPKIFKKIGSFNFSHSYGTPRGHEKGLPGADPLSCFMNLQKLVDTNGLTKSE